MIRNSVTLNLPQVRVKSVLPESRERSDTVSPSGLRTSSMTRGPFVYKTRALGTAQVVGLGTLLASWSARALAALAE